MKADFEKGTKVCNCCKKELPLDMFYKDKSSSDLLKCDCKNCVKKRVKIYKTSDKGKKQIKEFYDRTRNTFGRVGHKRGCSGILKRDYELSEQQLQKRNEKRNEKRKWMGITTKQKMYGILVWYSGGLEELSIAEYERVMQKEYSRQRNCAIRGYIARVNPSEHFLFDFDLEQMLKDRVCYGNNKIYITKWWEGEIRHWTVKDGVWKE